MPPFIQKYQLGEANSSASTAAVTVSLATAFVASFVSGFVADCLGRKQLFYIGAILNVLGCIIEIAGPNLVSFLIGRIITGLGVGVFSMLVPLYQSEIARPGNRGQLITLYQMGATLGTTIAYWISYGTYMKESDDTSWVLPIAFQLVPGGLLLLGLHLIPESPRWLIYRNRYDEALEIMALLRSDGKKDNLNLQMEFTGVRQDVGFDKRYTRKSFLALWSTGTENNLTRTLLGMGIHIFTQLSGINAILFYIPHIVEASGVMDRPTAVLIGNGIVGAVNFLGTLPCFWFIDRWDRRRILVIGALAMALSMIVVAILSSIYDNTMASSSLHRYIGTVFTPMSGDNKAPMYTILVFLCVFIAFFALSWGPVGWIYPAEIYPQIIRGNAMGVTTSASYFFNLVVTLVAPFMFMGMLWGTYLFFGCICLIMAWVVHRYYPETRGRSLEEINLIFSGALIDQRPGAHHPATAAEALLHLENFQHRGKHERIKQQQPATSVSATAAATEEKDTWAPDQLTGPISTVIKSLESNVAIPLVSAPPTKPTTAHHHDKGSLSTPTTRRGSLHTLRPSFGTRRASSLAANASSKRSPLLSTPPLDPISSNVNQVLSDSTDQQQVL
ncbi:unnamed protein product [Absidia cylindrospora]